MKIKCNFLLWLSTLLVTLSLVGCHDNTLSCSRDDVKATALHVVNRYVGWNMYEQLEGIRVQQQNAKTGLAICVAEAKSQSGSSVTVIYSIQPTDDNKDVIVTLLNR
ncbi:TPA: hypothetical protein RG734_000659 [Providencia stuartii]|nr:hypothetical protein [Providencia stuartii]